MFPVLLEPDLTRRQVVTTKIRPGTLARKTDPMRFIALVSFALVFLSAASATAGGWPQGTYLQSCAPISFKGDVLVAECYPLDHDLGMQVTALKQASRCIGDIGNADGKLTCSRWGLPDTSAIEQKEAYCKGRCACCASGNCGDTSICISKSASVDPKGYSGCFNTCRTRPIGSF
jgi:hypothetical protein